MGALLAMLWSTHVLLLNGLQPIHTQEGLIKGVLAVKSLEGIEHLFKGDSRVNVFSPQVFEATS
jgi:hypothetical protein